jgi:iron complex outermembrane receptor protein
MAGSTAVALEHTDRIVITEDEIKKMNVRNISDVLSQVPGVKAGDSFVSIRGSYKVKVLLDGRPINDPTSSHGGIKFDMVFLEKVEKIEVYRGKGGLKYGDDASGGVILITTKKIDTFHGNIKSFWGDFETSNYSANCRVNKGVFGIGASAGYEYTGGYQVNGDKKNRRTGGRIEYTAEDDLKMSFSVDYLKDERGLSGRPEYPTPHSRKKSEMLSCAMSASAKGIASETFFNDAEKKNIDPDRDIDNSITVKKFGEDISTSIETGKWGTVNYGVVFRWGQAESSRFASKDEQSISLFATDAISFETLPATFSFGLRGTVYSEFDNAVNPEEKISYKKDKWSFSFAHSRNNNTPSFYQRYDETSSKKPNPDLDMETSDNFSVSVATELLTSLSGEVSFFYNRITDHISYVLGDDGIGWYENFGEVTYKGGDIVVNWKIKDDSLSLRTAYTYLEAINEDTGKWLVCKPRHRANIDLSYKPMKVLYVILNVKYESKQFTRSDNKSSVQGRTIGNLRLEYGLDRFDIFGEIKNIGDKTYLYGDGWLAPPRTFIAGVNLRF